MTIIFEWNEDCVFIGHYKWPFRGHLQVSCLLANYVRHLWKLIKV
jgi:hypothetical protein